MQRTIIVEILQFALKLKLNKAEIDDLQSFEQNEKEQRSVANYDEQNNQSQLDESVKEAKPVDTVKPKVKVVNFKEDDKSLEDQESLKKSIYDEDRSVESNTTTEQPPIKEDRISTLEQPTDTLETHGANVSLNDDQASYDSRVPQDEKSLSNKENLIGFSESNPDNSVSKTCRRC
jgi:hypothetical protein